MALCANGCHANLACTLRVYALLTLFYLFVLAALSNLQKQAWFVHKPGRSQHSSLTSVSAPQLLHNHQCSSPS